MERERERERERGRERERETLHLEVSPTILVTFLARNFTRLAAL
jgi:hypothetical protein